MRRLALLFVVLFAAWWNGVKAHAQEPALAHGFDEAYAKTDWSRFARLPAFDAANRINAYGTSLPMEKESLARR